MRICLRDKALGRNEKDLRISMRDQMSSEAEFVRIYLRDKALRGSRC